MILAAAVVLAGCMHPRPIVRSSRPGAGTIIGITTVGHPSPEAVGAAFGAISMWEAALSEWAPSSMTSRAMAGETVHLPPEAAHLFDVADDLRVRTGGAFDVVRVGGPLKHEGDTLVAPSGTSLDLGGVLKGFLADRAADALRAQGVSDFVVDVGGDIVASGSRRKGRRGWPVLVVVGGTTRRVRLHDEALSTSGEDQQPGHIVDRRTGAPVHTLAGVLVRAPEGLLADGLATAVFASGGALVPPEGTWVEVLDAGRGWRTISREKGGFPRP